jgi:hypothetical protein
MIWTMTGQGAGFRMMAKVAGLVGLLAGLSLPPAARAAEAPPGGAALPDAATTKPVAAHPRTAAEIIPAAPQAEENAAPGLMEALAALETENVWDSTLAALAAEAYGSGYGAPTGNLVRLVEALHLPEEGNRSPTVDEVCEEFARRLEGPAARRALALCAAAVARPTCWFPLDYSQGPNLQLPHLAKLRNLARFLAATSYALAERGDAATAWECIVQQLRFADLLRDEPILITQLVRLAIARMAVSTLQDVAALAPPSPVLLRQLEALLNRLDDSAPGALAIDGERLLFGEWIFAQTPEKVRKLLNAEGVAKDAPSLTVDQLAAEHVAYAAALLRLADLVSQPYYRVKDELAVVARSASSPKSVVVDAILPSLVPYCGKMAEFLSSLRVSRIGLRLKTYRTEHGGYPANLSALQLADIPLEKQVDPCTGKALCYRLEGEEFVLYSVGLDGADDGGKPRLAAEKQGYDIVWRSAR